MSSEPATGSQSGPTGPADDNQRLRDLFFDGLPAMVGIVTLTVQPFAQDSTQHLFGLPSWCPIVVATAVAGLLAIYKLRVLRNSSPMDCVVCVPLLILVIFSGYATGNNIVFYAKAGITRADLNSQPASSDLTALKHENDILQQQLKSAQDLISTFQRAFSPAGASEGAPHASLPRLLGMLLSLGAGEAVAQTPPSDASGGLRMEQRQQLEDALKKYEEEQRQLEQQGKEKEPKVQKQQPEQQPLPPLIKSW